MPKPKFIAIRENGVVEIHASGDQYASLCGLDGNDPVLDQVIVELPKDPKIDCNDCKRLWMAWKKFSSQDFIKE